MATKRDAPPPRGILFQAPMVRQILAGKKTITSMLLDPQPPSQEAVRQMSGSGYSLHLDTDGYFRVYGPVWAVRKILNVEPEWRCTYRPFTAVYVKEPWRPRLVRDRPGEIDVDVLYAADEKSIRFTHASGEIHAGWKLPKAARRGFVSGRLMPRWAARIELEVLAVRAERLSDITEDDILQQGVTVDQVARWCNVEWSSMPTLHHAFQTYWDSFHGADAKLSFVANPVVARIAFRVTRIRNADD